MRTHRLPEEAGVLRAGVADQGPVGGLPGRGSALFQPAGGGCERRLAGRVRNLQKDRAGTAPSPAGRLVFVFAAVVVEVDAALDEAHVLDRGRRRAGVGRCGALPALLLWAASPHRCPGFRPARPARQPIGAGQRRSQRGQGRLQCGEMLTKLGRGRRGRSGRRRGQRRPIVVDNQGMGVRVVDAPAANLVIGGAQ